MICVSKCLLGINCRYDGKNMRNEHVIEYLKDKEYISICPECDGGLSTPREPSEIKDGKVYSKSGKDVTKEFELGAQIALEKAKEYGCTCAIFQENSPSCGTNFVYDGTFTGNKVQGKGITAKLFEKNGIQVLSSNEFQ